MKKFILPVLALVVIFILPSCSEKFKVAAPYKNITVIYGLLDRADTAHYVRIQKAFLDDTKSALNMAQVADSSFYNNISVKMEEVNMDDHSIFGSIQLSRVDLNLEGYPKQTGAFFNAPNYAYKFKGDLDPTLIYRLVVTNMATGQSDSADAPVIDDENTSVFTIYLLDDTSNTHQQMDFSNTSANEKAHIFGSYYAASNFTFQNPTTPLQYTPAYLVQGIIRFHWVDSVGIPGGAKTPRSYDYNMGYTSMNGTSFDYYIKNLDLFNALGTGLGTAGADTFRLIDRCELFLYLGTYDFNVYSDIQSLQGTGLTGNEIQPIYTNIQGKDALGLFTSRGIRNGLFTLSNRTVLALADSPSTLSAKVVGTVY